MQCGEQREQNSGLTGLESRENDALSVKNSRSVLPNHVRYCCDHANGVEQQEDSGLLGLATRQGQALIQEWLCPSCNQE